MLASLTELKKQKEKNKKNLKKKEQQEKEKKAKRKREGAKINRNWKTQQGKEEEKERNERMRTIAIASYFSRDFKKSIELMMMTHSYNQFQNWEDAGYAQNFLLMNKNHRIL